jgi:hypothetical protein
MVDESGNGLVFILSTPRAGSTLLGAILGSHSQILSPPEPWLMLVLAGLRDDTLIVRTRFDYRYARRAIHNAFRQEIIDRSFNAFARTAYDGLLESSGKSIIVDKTPPYYQILPFLDDIFPKAHKIYLQRNPLDVIASAKSTWNVSIHDIMSNPLSRNTFHLTVSFRILADHFRVDRSDTLRVRYEDLIKDPSSVISSLCTFLSLPFEASMLNYGENRRLVENYRRSAAGDRHVLEHSTVHGNSMGRWRAVLTPEEVREILQTLGSRVFIDSDYDDDLDQAVAYAGLADGELPADGTLPQLFTSYRRFAGTLLDNPPPTGVYNWEETAYAGREQVQEAVPPGETFIVVGDDQWGLAESLPNRRSVPFLERDGVYWGVPADDATAIQELERLRGTGANFLVFGAPAFWWFDRYQDFHRYLRTTYPRVLETERVVVFQLHLDSDHE